MSNDCASPTPLERRRIEATVASAFHRVAAERLGEQVAEELLSAAVDSMACSAAYARSGGAALSLEELWGVWLDLGGESCLGLHLEELSDTTLKFSVGRCAYADMYRELGIPELGVAFSCRRDEPFARALVPGVRVEQSRTILEGSDRCEFTYTLEGR